MRTPALVLVCASLLACGEAPSCPDSRPLSREELALFSEVALLVQVSEARPPLVAEQELDESCPGGWDIRTPAGECVYAYYDHGCRALILPAGLREAWPEFWAFLIRHESSHHLLQQKTGDPDKGHEDELWAAIRPPWEEQ